jgi:hypothetical protein
MDSIAQQWWLVALKIRGLAERIKHMVSLCVIPFHSSIPGIIMSHPPFTILL